MRKSYCEIISANQFSYAVETESDLAFASSGKSYFIELRLDTFSREWDLIASLCKPDRDEESRLLACGCLSVISTIGPPLYKLPEKERLR